MVQYIRMIEVKNLLLTFIILHHLPKMEGDTTKEEKIMKKRVSIIFLLIFINISVFAEAEELGEPLKIETL